MKKLILIGVALSAATAASAQTVHVREHVTQNGTYVPAHERTAPNSTPMDNWSTRGNVNPNTGRPGTVDPYAPKTPKPYGY